MNRLSQPAAAESEDEYRAIEAALLETARGRWFLSEHGRRARRLDSALLDEAIGRLQTSLRQPPALLGQLRGELEDLKQHLDIVRGELIARPIPAQQSGAGDAPVRTILKAAEDLHEIAWSLQANPFDPEGCERIARSAAQLYATSQHQAAVSERTLTLAEQISEALQRVDAVLETIAHEGAADGG